MKKKDQILLEEAYQKIVEVGPAGPAPGPLPRRGPGSIGYVEKDVYMVDLYNGAVSKSDKLPEEITQPNEPADGFEEVPGQGENLSILKKQGKGYIFVITPKPDQRHKLCIKIQLPSLAVSVVEPYEANKMVKGLKGKEGTTPSRLSYKSYKGKDFIMLVFNETGLPAFDDQLPAGARNETPVAQQPVTR
jgi:hypothetical protein